MLASPGPHPHVSLVVNTYQQARDLPAALDSALAQTRPFDEIVVLDDGSTDDPAAVVERFPGVRIVRQANAGLAAARNAGLAAVSGDFVVFLDADDLLQPDAVAAGLACHAAHPGCAFVYGAFRRVDGKNVPLGGTQYTPIGERPYLTLLHGNCIGMHATVMYDTAALRDAGGFDASLPRCEDYDLYFRIARTQPIASHRTVVAHYRWHGDNMSADHATMLDWVLRINDRQKPHTQSNPKLEAARIEGRRIWRRYYATRHAEDLRSRWQQQRKVLPTMRQAITTMTFAPPYAGLELGRMAMKGAGGALRRRLTGRSRPVGSVDLGDLGTTRPISMDFGFDRGTPVDRFYVAEFLDRQRSLIQGRALEVGDDSYCRRFGGGAVSRQDILYVDDSNPHATITGDLSDPAVLPSDAFDCIVLTQTLHLIFDVHQAARQLHRALKPGGVLLLTVPGITPLERGVWGRMWCWSFTGVSARLLFGALFGEENVAVDVQGNVLSATAMLQGLAAEELKPAQLREVDPAYPVLVTVVARKAETR